ncbi:Uncharacterized protein ALO82_01142 [Pseudomonas syringae pv. broussonetiae]|uniref:Uncharacterized protein n=1 Tax=Pseudomonas savastanoi TaxID=29438 RepID=A0A3M5B1J6_PSESS|nr:TnsD family Tn7-like transposition protein [Pseudomonas savastanoi]KPW65095.1 Uncharacterized protein ALO82_01142 [Pseudomonas syringae pv. broussonetiae]KWT04005.1 transposase [Pseudomonas syringae pv. broussonetiae]RMS19236.1 hypothetical protein ALP70_05285 [Pseudomonas savastanoi]RMT16840.1 hypothetical protein ALP51_05417 [Pseudomonas savastanoi]
MYFPRLYPDELLYSGIARCRVHLGICSHKTLLHMLFGDSKVAAITDLPTHLTALANNTGLDAAHVIMRHTLFPLYAPFIPQKRRVALYQAMLASDQPTIGLAGASTALVKWPEWLRYCPICFDDMATRFGEVYWRRSWQILGINACPEHGCLLLNSPIPFRRAQRHEFHPASPSFLTHDLCKSPASEDAIRLAETVMQLLGLDEEQSPGYGRWSSLYRYLATECGARRGHQIRAEVIWERVLASHRRDWLTANGLLTSEEPPPWLLAMFRKHRKGFSALQHLVVWISIRPDRHIQELINEANTHQAEVSTSQSLKQLPAEMEEKQQYRVLWLQALDQYGGAKATRQNGGNACYAWLYRHDRHWLMAANQVRQRRQGNNSQIDWRARDRKLVSLLIRIGRDGEEDLSLPRRSRNWLLQLLPHRASVEHHLDQMPLCCTFLDRYAESVGEYQIRRLTAAMLDDVQTGTTSKRWELEKRCGLDKSRMAALTIAFLQLIGMMN